MTNIIIVSSVILSIAGWLRAAYWRNRFDDKRKECDKWMDGYIIKSQKLRIAENALEPYRKLINGMLKFNNDSKN